MRLPIKTGVVVLLGIGAAISSPHVKEYWKARYQTKYQEEEISRGRVVFHVNSTGTVQPVLSVTVGAFVSGPIEKLYVDFNQVVKKGQLLAKIDTRLPQSNLDSALAGLLRSRADVDRAKAVLKQAENDLKRAEALRKTNKDYVSDTEMDQYRFNRASLDAQVKLAEAAVKQADAALDNAKANMEYCEIKSPVDGIVINRKIDPGQTVASQFQTPELFIVAPDMTREMYVLATVDEADIGLTRKAKERGQPVEFTVDAYPDDLFQGKIAQIRMNSTTTQNVVTYPVVVSVPNPDLKLLPGMTANLSFQIQEEANALRVPNSALRFYPKPEQVRLEDRPILEGLRPATDKEKEETQTTPSALEKATANSNRNRRHLWIVDGEFLRAIEVVTGISDHKYTVILSGELVEGQSVVTGIQNITPK